MSAPFAEVFGRPAAGPDLKANLADLVASCFDGRARTLFEFFERDRAAVMVLVQPLAGHDVEPTHFWIYADRVDGGWYSRGGGHGTLGWAADPEPGAKVGVLSLGGRVPQDCKSVGGRFRDRTTAVPVREGFFGWAHFGVREGETRDVEVSLPSYDTFIRNLRDSHQVSSG